MKQLKWFVPVLFVVCMLGCSSGMSKDARVNACNDRIETILNTKEPIVKETYEPTFKHIREDIRGDDWKKASDMARDTAERVQEFQRNVNRKESELSKQVSPATADQLVAETMLYYGLILRHVDPAACVERLKEAKSYNETNPNAAATVKEIKAALQDITGLPQN